MGRSCAWPGRMPEGPPVAVDEREQRRLRREQTRIALLAEQERKNADKRAKATKSKQEATAVTSVRSPPVDAQAAAGDDNLLELLESVSRGEVSHGPQLYRVASPTRSECRASCARFSPTPSSPPTAASRAGRSSTTRRAR